MREDAAISMQIRSMVVASSFYTREFVLDDYGEGKNIAKQSLLWKTRAVAIERIYSLSIKLWPMFSTVVVPNSYISLNNIFESNMFSVYE